jgi:periplasmic protein CpxP/Spy
MKKLFLAALCCGCLTWARAQDARPMPSPETRSERQVEALSKRMTLSEEQKVQVRSLYLVQAKTADSIRSAANGDFRAVRGQVQSVQEATDQKILKLLNEEQKKKFEQYLEERKARMQGARRGQ